MVFPVFVPFVGFVDSWPAAPPSAEGSAAAEPSHEPVETAEKAEGSCESSVLGILESRLEKNGQDILASVRSAMETREGLMREEADRARDAFLKKTADDLSALKASVFSELSGMETKIAGMMADVAGSVGGLLAAQKEAMKKAENDETLSVRLDSLEKRVACCVAPPPAPASVEAGVFASVREEMEKSVSALKEVFESRLSLIERSFNEAVGRTADLERRSEVLRSLLDEGIRSFSLAETRVSALEAAARDHRARDGEGGEARRLCDDLSLRLSRVENDFPARFEVIDGVLRDLSAQRDRTTQADAENQKRRDDELASFRAGFESDWTAYKEIVAQQVRGAVQEALDLLAARTGRAVAPSSAGGEKNDRLETLERMMAELKAKQEAEGAIIEDAFVSLLRRNVLKGPDLSAAVHGRLKSRLAAQCLSPLLSAEGTE